MFHPLFRLLARKPHLVAHHLAGYAELASAQGQDIAQALRDRLAWSAGALVCALLGGAIGGGALLVLAAVPVASMPAPWLLLVAPGVPLLGALVCLLQAHRRPVTWSLAPMRAQLRADAALLAELENA